MKRVLITGANGFTGQYMIQEMLSAGYEVYGTGLSRSEDPFYFQTDLMNLKQVQHLIDDIKPNYVIHLAGLSYVEHSDPDSFYELNVLGTRHLLSALSVKQTPIKGILLTSSANIYGNASEGIQHENTPSNPANDYAVSKLAMEYMAKLWMTQLPIIITRPFNYTGVGQAEHFLLPKIVSHFRDKKAKIELGNINVSRDFSDVRDVVYVYRRLLEKKNFGEIVNICSGKAYGLQQIINFCEELTNHKIEVCTHLNMIRSNEVNMLCGDPRKLYQSIGVFEHRPLQDTLSWMLTI